MRKGKKKIILLLILVIGISIGYAALANMIKINGTSVVKGSNWNIYWDNVNVESGSVTGANVITTPTTVGTTTTEVAFSVVLPEPGDYYEFTIDAVNAGTIDAMIEDNGVQNKVYSDSAYTQEATLPDVVKYTVTNLDGTAIESGHVLSKKSGNTPTKETYKVRVEYRNDEEINPSDLDKDNDKTYYFKFAVTYVQADNTAAEREKLVQLPAGKTKDNLVLGDEITVGTEQFNFIRYDGNNIVMLAKWNLNVGNNPKTAETFKQDSDVKGYISGGTKYGNVAFSATNYWSSITTYPADVYDNTYKTAPDFTGSGYSTTGYSVAYYVEKYKKILEDMGLTISEARLLTYTEATDSTIGIGCDGGNLSCPTTGFITNTSFWLGSANGSNNLWIVFSNGVFYRDYFNGGSSFGVRPVIVISKSEV